MLEWVLRITGASLIILSAFHAVLWRILGWNEEVTRLSPLNARVFAVHTFFLAFVLLGLGLLSMLRPGLLLAPSELARFLLSFVVLFWMLRLAMQPLIFDRLMRQGWTGALWLRVGATLIWMAYTVIYGAALVRLLAE